MEQNQAVNNEIFTMFGIQLKITGHTKMQENVTPNQEDNQSVTGMAGDRLRDKGLITAITGYVQYAAGFKGNTKVTWEVDNVTKNRRGRPQQMNQR